MKIIVTTDGEEIKPYCALSKIPSTHSYDDNKNTMVDTFKKCIKHSNRYSSVGYSRMYL